MVDNTRINAAAGSDGDLIADDEITDGGVADGAKVQRVKVGHGPDGFYQDVSDDTALPVILQTYSSGPGSNDQPLRVAGSDVVSTPVRVTVTELPVASTLMGSTSVVDDGVTLDTIEAGAFNVAITGTWDGTLGFQGSAGDDVWEPITVLDLSTGDYVTETTSNGAYLGQADYPLVRIYSTAWTSGTASMVAVARKGVPHVGPVSIVGGGIVPVTIDGTVIVSNLPTTQPVSIADPLPVTDNSGSLTVDDGGGSLTIDGSVSITGTPTVNVNTHAVTASGTFPVTDNGGSLTVDGSITADTELPTAVAQADGLAPSTAPQVLAVGYVHSSLGVLERVRNAAFANGTSGTGVPAAGMMGYDGTNVRRVKTDAAGVVQVAPPTATTGTLSTVAGSATSVSLLASNTSRKGAIIWNDSTALLYVALASTASATAYTWQVAPGGYCELPDTLVYTGAVAGIWTSATGNARVTELT